MSCTRCDELLDEITRLRGELARLRTELDARTTASWRVPLDDAEVAAWKDMEPW